jgi:heparosan-N-sulfate-glucuronate 5-epimerase
MMLARSPQLRGSFEPGVPTSGYYNDLRGVADGYGSPGEAEGWLELLVRRRERAWPVALLQLGLGSWQHVHAGAQEWRTTLEQVVEWAVLDMDGHGRFAHYQAMPHTFELQPPWFSAMSQGQAASLFVRAAETLGQPELLQEARRAIGSLVAPESVLVAATPEGPVLQEYPTDPPAHVLNGWIWALWGLYDVAVTSDDAGARAAFRQGVDTLVARLPLYEVGRGWSRYDLYPHPIRNVASPFYHRLHVEQLRALHELVPEQAELVRVADRWEAALGSPRARVDAVARKVGFRMLKPRRKAA